MHKTVNRLINSWNKPEDTQAPLSQTYILYMQKHTHTQMCVCTVNSWIPYGWLTKAGHIRRRKDISFIPGIVVYFCDDGFKWVLFVIKTSMYNVYSPDSRLIKWEKNIFIIW